MIPTKLVTKVAKLMGSPFLIQTYVTELQDVGFVEKMIALAFGEIARIEDLLTDFRDSPVSDINKMAGIKPVKVCQEVFDLIALALGISRQSDGAFDISYAALGHLWREAATKGEPPLPQQINEARQYVDYRKIQMHAHSGEIFLPHKKMRIGLGGIGKGYGVDKAFELLKKNGLENFVVNGAGDIRVHSLVDAPRPWRVGIRNPLAQKDTAMGVLQIRNGAVATSGDYERFFRHNGKNYHHVIDPRTGNFTREVCSVTVLAPTTLMADVYATTAMVLGTENGVDFLNHLRHVSGFLVTGTGKVVKTSSLLTNEFRNEKLSC